MKRKTLIVIVLIAAAFLLFTGCGRKKEAVAETTPVVEERENIPVEEAAAPAETIAPAAEETVKPVEKETIDAGPATFTVQLISLPDRSRVVLQQEIMQKKGVATEISTFEMQGVTYYRLRLAGRYTRTKAELLGEQMKEKFGSITDYWVVKG
ncbi:MAG: hypothetical protein K9N06_02360 [Candidatus Cloacimonetes bacterium]|nr:hypothetical protein [Candidatus Cloacimonadota bacterium]